MRIPIAVKIGTVILSFLSLFWFPWIISLVLMVISGFMYAPTPLALGILADILYYPGHGWFVGALSGAGIALVSWAVRHFVKTRII